jgi:environmental stress-induced protein Ves
MHVLRAADRKPTAWKNGGGTTWEVAASPAGSTLDTFGWRTSIAEVAADGAFSNFPDVDRVLTVIAGSGLELKFKDTRTMSLGERSEPFEFPGDAPCEAVLAAGAIRDFNVMTRRGAWSAKVRRATPPGPFQTQADMILLLACAPLDLGALQLLPEDAVLLEGPATIDFSGGSLVIAELRRL